MVAGNYQEVVQTTNPWQSKKQTDYLRFRHNRKSDRHKLDRKTRYWRDFLKSENYHLISLENLLQKNLLNGGRETYLALAINNRTCFFFKEGGLRVIWRGKKTTYLLTCLGESKKSWRKC